MSTEKDHFYQLAARGIAASTRLYNVDSVVHVEDKDDIWFWQQILNAFRPGKYKFLRASDNDHGKKTTGCEQCLKYKEFLSQRFFICIDSDLRYLLDEKIKSEEGVLQTYTYSWENHCCFAEKLQKEFAEKTGGGDNFDFVDFLHQYSSIVYQAFLVMLYHERNHLPGFNREKFKQLISLQYKGGDEKNNGRQLLERLRASLDSACSDVIKELRIDLEAEARRYEAKGITINNVYLYVRGHCLYNMLNSLGKQLCKETGVDFEQNILKTELAIDLYNEIKHIKKDIAIFNGIKRTV